MEWEFADHEPGATQGAFLLVTVPVTRNVASILATALLRAPSRRLVATIHSDRMPPVSMSYEGVVSGPMQVWAIPGPAGPGGQSAELYLLASDVRLSAEALMGFCGALARWVKSKGFGFTLAIEGADANEFPPHPTLATTHAGEGVLDALKLPPYEGVHAGLNAALLARFNQHRLAAAGLFAPTPGDISGDANAAVAALHAVAPLMPPQFAKEPLERVARGLAELVERSQNEQESAQRDLAAQARHDPGYA